MDKNNEEVNYNNQQHNINNGLDVPYRCATTAELMLEFGKNIDESLDIHNDLEKIINCK